MNLMLLSLGVEILPPCGRQNDGVSVGDFPLSFHARPTASCHSEPRPMVECEESPAFYRLRFFLLAVVRMTSFCNFFPAAKKLPRKVARWLSGIPASRFARRRGLRNSLRSNSPRPISVFSLAPGSPIKAGIFPLRHYRPH